MHHLKAADNLTQNQEKWFEKSYEFGTDKEIMEVSAENIELCGEIDEEFIEHTRNLAEKMKELGIIAEVPDIEALFDLTFLENAE